MVRRKASARQVTLASPSVSAFDMLTDTCRTGSVRSGDAEAIGFLIRQESADVWKDCARRRNECPSQNARPFLSWLRHGCSALIEMSRMLA